MKENIMKENVMKENIMKENVMKENGTKRNMMKKIVLICALSVTTPALAAEIPDADSAAARLFAQTCSACHAMPYPQRLDWPHWRHILGVMRQRMQERGVAEPSKAQWRQIAGYLKSHAR